jgi:hypothetical protein
LVSWALSSYSISIADMRADMGWSRLGAAAGISVYVRPPSLAECLAD